MWWPWQSRQARDLCNRLSPLGKAGMVALEAAYAGWLVCTVALPWWRVMRDPNWPHVGSAVVFGALALSLTYVYLSVVKCYLLCSKEGRRLGYRADALALFRFDETEGEPRRNGAIGGRTDT